jgi:RimJ/RimL family protein N-acetyltransferase
MVPRIETERLVIRPFVPEDWPGMQALAINKESSRGARYDHTWPTTEDECKGMAEYFAGGQYYAAVLKQNQRIIGLLAFNSIDANKQLDLGHVMHTEFQDNDHDREALEAIIDFAFRDQDIASVITLNVAAPDWTEQIAPLKSLGLTPIAEDKPGELVISRQDWESRQRPEAPSQG